jgi:AraC-like DNA-binding protein
VHVLPVTTVRAMLLGFEALGLDCKALVAAAKLRPTELEKSDGALPAECFGALWKEAMRQAPREELPTEVGFAVPFGAFGALDYLARSSATVKAAFFSLQAHFRYARSAQLEIVEDRTNAIVRIVSTGRFESRAVADEMTLALFVARFRTMSSFLISGVSLTRPAPASTDRHQTLFDATVRFGCKTSALTLPASTWRAPLPNADPVLQRLLRSMAERLDLGAQGSNLELAIRARLRAALPEGDTQASSAAKALGLSVRTLHRQLKGLSTTWGEVIDHFREVESERLLSASPHARADIALTLGFSDQTAWNRAFKRWKGVSPTQWLKERYIVPQNLP